jgi:hypothetical protein
MSTTHKGSGTHHDDGSFTFTPDTGGTVPPDPGTPPAFDPSKPPWVSTSAWNKPVKSNARYTNIAWPASTGWNYWCTWESTGVPVYISKPDDPMVQVTCKADWGWPANPSLRMPKGADGCPGSPGESNPDHPIVVVDGTMAWNFWRFYRDSDTTAHATSQGKSDVITGTGWGDTTPSPDQGAGTAACAASQLGGLLMQAETDAGDIKHALGLACQTSLIRPGTVAPAIANDGKTANGPLQESMLLAIPSGTAMPSNLSPLGQKVFNAFKNYGAYVTDDGGSDRTTIRANHLEYDQATMDRLRQDMPILIRMLKIVS